MSVFFSSPHKNGENRHKKCTLNNWETKLFAHKWKLYYIAGFYHKREKWCLNNSLFPPPAPHSEREGLNQTEFVENIIFVSKELIRCEERTDKEKSQGNRTLRMECLGRRHEVHFQFYQWPCVSHLSSWDLSLFICTLIIYGINVISQKWLWQIFC